MGSQKSVVKKNGTGFFRKALQFRELTLVILIVVIFVIIGSMNSRFLGSQNIETTLLSVAVNGIVGIGMTIVLVSGGLDLSVGGVMAVSAAALGVVFLETGSVVLGFAVCMIVAVLFGVINGLLITKAKLSAFIATLATMGISRGITMVLTKGTPLSLTNIPDWAKEIGGGKVAGISYIIILFVIMTVVAHLFLKKSKVLRKAVYVGGNEVAAHYSGINVNRMKFGVYVLSSILCGIGAILSVCRFYSASPKFGEGLEVKLIAAAVIGGASMEGGQGSVIGSSIAIILLGFVDSGIVLLGVSVYWQNLVSSIILLLAVLLDSFVEARKNRVK